MRVRIYKPARNAMQSGIARTKEWVLVYPAADLPFTALTAGAMVVEINPQPTPLSPHVTFSLNGAAGVVLPALIAQTWGLVA